MKYTLHWSLYRGKTDIFADSFSEAKDCFNKMHLTRLLNEQEEPFTLHSHFVQDEYGQVSDFNKFNANEALDKNKPNGGKVEGMPYLTEKVLVEKCVGCGLSFMGDQYQTHEKIDVQGACDDCLTLRDSLPSDSPYC